MQTDEEVPPSSASKSDHAFLMQDTPKEIYKKRITEYIYNKKDGLNCMQRFSSKCLSNLINFIWQSYACDMGRINHWWNTNPPPPLIAPVWLEEHLKPIVSKLIDEQMALSSSG